MSENLNDDHARIGYDGEDLPGPTIAEIQAEMAKDWCAVHQCHKMECCAKQPADPAQLALGHAESELSALRAGDGLTC